MAELWSVYDLARPRCIVVQILAIVVPLLLAVAYLTYAERKVIGGDAAAQGAERRRPFGLLQPFADGAQAADEGDHHPDRRQPVVFLIAPMITFILALVAWAVIPFERRAVVLADINVGILYLFAISSLGVYGIIMAGWASNSKYAFLGALRSAAQMVSYEVSIGFVMITVLLCVGSLNLSRHRRGAAGGMLSTGSRPAAADVRDLLHLGAGRDEPRAVRPAGGGSRAGRRLQRRILGDDLRACSSSANTPT